MLKKRRETIPNHDFRNYGIDALRILSMLMVVMLHVLGHGGILEASKSTNYWIVWLFEISAYGAVNLYALISGYVGVYSKYRISNLAALWCRVAFYSVSITLICKVIIPDRIGKKDILFSFFPIFSKQYWYFTAYALLFLFIPILNEGLNRLSKKKLGILLLAVVTATSVFQPIVSIFFGDVFGLENGYSSLWLIILYLLGGFIRKYGLFHNIKTHRVIVFFVMYFVFVLATWLSKLSIQFVSTLIWGEIKFDELLISYQSITILGSAVSLLLAFEKLNLRPKHIKVISFLSPLAFSVYLIHEKHIIKNTLIIDRFSWIAGLPAFQMIPVLFGIVIATYLICSLIDLFRSYLFKAIKLKDRLNTLELKVRKKISDIKTE